MTRRNVAATALAATLALAGCTDTGADPADQYIGGYANGYFISGQRGCGARMLQGLVGQPSMALNAANVPYGTRVIFPDSPQTEGYDANRVTVNVDAAGRIASVACG